MSTELEATFVEFGDVRFQREDVPVDDRLLQRGAGLVDVALQAQDLRIGNGDLLRRESEHFGRVLVQQLGVLLCQEPGDFLTSCFEVCLSFRIR